MEQDNTGNVDEQMNQFYKAKYSKYENDLSNLAQQINQDFFEEEFLLIDKL